MNCKYTNTNGAASNNPSNLSSKPPWPGKKEPESFVERLRFNIDSQRSPNVPAETMMADIPSQ